MDGWIARSANGWINDDGWMACDRRTGSYGIADLTEDRRMNVSPSVPLALQDPLHSKQLPELSRA